MKKRIMSIVLCLVMVVSLLPTQALAAYEDGAECANCDHWHYDDWMCECGLCSENCSNSDCWYETHCKNCGACYMSADNWCDECGWCEDCMKNEENTHCEDCGRCFVGDSKDELCERCNKCSDCVGEICDECGLCDECAGDDHCENCPAHLEDDDVCGYCKDCALTMGLHCEECGECFEDSAEHCPVHLGENHCAECAGFICESCDHCEYEDGIEPCPDCELCTDCCEEISRSKGCSTGEVCVESSDWDDHICEECGECFCEKERCGYCGLCEDCCIENAEAAGCYCGNTVEVGKTFTVTSIISPDNVADRRVKWMIESAGIIKLTESYSARDDGTVSKDIEGEVSLIALKPGIVLLRAISTESNNTSSNTPIQDSVYVKVVPAKGETHNYAATVVYPTCTKNGYTLYECKDENCGHRYQNNIQAATKHKDTDGDGYCDNIDQNTSKVCGYQMNGGSMSMVGFTKIKKVELTIAAPVRGSSPATTATPAGDEKDCYSVANVTWDPDTKTFAGGTKYSVLLKLEAKDEYGFKLDGIEVANTQFYINGNKAAVVSKGAQEVSISYEFPATDIGSTGSTTYTVKVLESKNGDVTSSHKTAAKGTTVTLTVSPDKGYTLETLTVLDKSGKEIKLTEKNGKYTFAMPASNVEVKATFMDDNTMLNFFVDVKAGDYFYDAVLWAAEKGITGGTDATHFTPNGVCTRAQAVTFLWRAAGSPAPKSTAMPFTDVAAGSYYEQAVLWAVENGITKGTSDTTFSPNATCSRAQIVTFLWRSQKSPAAGSVNPFMDVSADAYYADAVLWAVKESVTGGTTATTFSPNADCTRAQIVTFIYRALAE